MMKLQNILRITVYSVSNIAEYSNILLKYADGALGVLEIFFHHFGILHLFQNQLGLYLTFETKTTIKQQLISEYLH